MNKGLVIAILGVLIVLGSVGAYLYGTHLTTVWTDKPYVGNLPVIPENYNPTEYSKGVTLVQGGILGMILGAWVAAFGCYLIIMDKMQDKERIKNKSDVSND